MNKNIGWIVFGTLIFYLLSVPVPLLLPLPTLFAWMVPILTWFTLAKNARRQASLLVVLGFGAIIFSVAHGVFLGWRDIFAINLPLLAMFVAVSFLTLTNPATDDPCLPEGNGAIVSTAVGTHLLGAVINLSVLFVFGDRLKRNGALSKEQLVVLGRCFTAAAWWSPFFVATGVALTYAPEMQWKETLVPGAIMSFIGISYTVIEVWFFRKKGFSGYPLKKESLAVPLFLAAVVILVHYQWHQVSVLLLICLLAPLGTLLFMKGRPRGATIGDFVANKISSVSSPFALFLAAGVFSSGIKSITHVYPGLFTFNNMELSPMVFAILAGIMILVGIIGVHPVVSIAVVSPLLLPLNPDHSQLAFLFLTSWAISTCSSPLSGVGLVLVSRFHAPPKVIIKDNFLYAVVMWAIATQMNIIFFTH